MYAKDVKAMGIQNNKDPYAELWMYKNNEQEEAQELYGDVLLIITIIF
jgi:hypothetical protein